VLPLSRRLGGGSQAQQKVPFSTIDNNGYKR
jgi:hypothetical protein